MLSFLQPFFLPIHFAPPPSLMRRPFPCSPYLMVAVSEFFQGRRVPFLSEGFLDSPAFRLFPMRFLPPSPFPPLALPSFFSFLARICDSHNFFLVAQNVHAPFSKKAFSQISSFSLCGAFLFGLRYGFFFFFFVLFFLPFLARTHGTLSFSPFLSPLLSCPPPYSSPSPMVLTRD